MLVYVVGRLQNGVVCDPISCEIDVSTCPLEDLGGGYRGYYVKKPWPNVESCVVDSRTGAMFSGTLYKARQDIKDARIKDSNQRVATALNIREQATKVSPEEFWSLVIQMLTKSA